MVFFSKVLFSVTFNPFLTEMKHYFYLFIPSRVRRRMGQTVKTFLLLPFLAAIVLLVLGCRPDDHEINNSHALEGSIVADLVRQPGIEPISPVV